jgi:mono/diheme cytochrome c family protein
MKVNLKTPGTWGIASLAAAFAMTCWATAIAQSSGRSTTAGAAQAKPAATSAAKRGEYLVKAVGCGDCHTPHKMGPNGPEEDMSRMLSGHPSDMALPPSPKAEGPWIASFAGTMTAWAGPWGISYTANLTPDPETGLGKWTEQQFIDTIRTGRHQGRGRQILPPMPWQAIQNFNDADLKSIFAYLRSIPPVKNHVPDPVMAAPGSSTK